LGPAADDAVRSAPPAAAGTSRSFAILWAVVAVAAVAMALILFIGWLPAWGEWWGLDGARVLAVARTWLDGGDPYYSRGYLYTPLAFLLAVPWTGLPDDVALGGWFVLRVVVVAGAALYATRGMSSAVRAIATAVALVCVPVLAEYIVGNVTILLAAAMLPVIYGRHRLSGVPFAIAFVAAPKPLMVAFLGWVLIHRRPMVVPMLAGGLAATAIATVIAGPANLVAWLGTVTSFGGGSLDFMGNTGLTASAPGWFVVVASIATAAFVVFSLARADESTSLVVATVAGLILTPYSGSNLAVIVLPALSLYARHHPGHAAIVAAAIVALPFGLPLFAAFGLVVASLPDRSVRANA
jgi:hypothetical protein